MGGGAPNSTIADLTDVRNGFWDRCFRAGLGRTVADSGFFIELFAAFGIMFLSSFVFRHASRPRRNVRSLYKLIGFLVPPQKSCPPSQHQRSDMFSRLLVLMMEMEIRDGDWRLEIEDGYWRLNMEIGEWRWRLEIGDGN